MDYVDKIRLTRLPNKTIGHIWVNILIEFNYKTGESKVLRSYNVPAKDSYIKKITKVKPKVFVPKIETKKTEGRSLF